jgi:hypothetical protein
MSDEPGEQLRSEAAQAWDSVRRIREPVAWIILVVTAVAVFVSALQLFGIVKVPLPNTSGPVTTFSFRAASVAPQFVAGGIFTLPVLAVILAAFAGGLTQRARQVVQTAASIQAVALGLGVLSWLGSLGRQLPPYNLARPPAWYIFDATDLVALAAALIFIVAVLNSRALQPPAPDWIGGEDDDDEDFDEDLDDSGEDA